MKLLDKIKDLFMDEIAEDEEIELEEDDKEIYREPPKDVLPKVMRDTIKEEEKVELKVKPEEIIKKQEQSIEMPKKFNFPMDFENELPTRNQQKKNNVNVLKVEREVPKKVSELYPKKEEVKEKPKFKPTPVISPVYGVLDKNYTKEEVKEKTEDMVEMKRPSKKVDFETVRKKAFGNLADEIKDNLMCENCELYKEVKKISSLHEDDLLYDMTIDENPEEITIEKAYDNYEEFGVAYEPKEEIKIEQIDEENEINITKTIPENEEEHFEEEIIMEEDIIQDVEIDKKIPSRQGKKKETKVDADFFELIDSMYKERVDE